MTVQRGFHTEVRDHGKKQLEFRSHYPLTDRKIDRYTVDVWMYFPLPLGINGQDYGVDRFFSDIKCLTRYSASYIPLPRLVDPECDISPLHRIRKTLGGAALPQDIARQNILYELRSLANIYESEIVATERIMADAVSEGRMSVVKDTIKGNLKDIKAFLDTWRDLYSLFLEPAVDVRLREAYAWTDESISITTEKALHDLHLSISPDDEAPSLVKRINKIMEGEEEHRRTMGYRSLPSEASSSEAERRIYRESVLKKWGQSALYLNHEESTASRNMGHILAGIAAATAMAFAVVVTLWAESRFPGRSLPWALAIIIAYIFKDRIKETLRNVLMHTFPSLVTDQRVKLIDQASGRRVGKVSGRARFLKAHSAPPEISRVRNSGENPFRSILPEEDLIQYRREITIRNRILRKAHTRLDTFTDTIRFRLEHVFRGMDDPEKIIPILSGGKATQIKGHRVYHLNVVIRLNHHGDPTGHIAHYRVVLNRDGLVRIEDVG